MLKLAQGLLFLINQLLALLEVGLQIGDMLLCVGEDIVEFSLGSGPLILLLDHFLELLDVCDVLREGLLTLV